MIGLPTEIHMCTLEEDCTLCSNMVEVDDIALCNNPDRPENVTHRPYYKAHVCVYAKRLEVV